MRKQCMLIALKVRFEVKLIALGTKSLVRGPLAKKKCVFE